MSMLRYAGTPFQFLVTDLNKAAARGDGLGSVRSGQVATFFITAPAAQLKDINVSICGTCSITLSARPAVTFPVAKPILLLGGRGTWV